MTMFRYSLSLYFFLAFIWCEEVRSFSSLSRPTTRILPGGTTKLESQPSFSTIPKSPLQFSHLRMTTDDSVPDPLASKEESGATNKEEVDKNSNSIIRNITIVVPLLLKFSGVLMIKFVTDAIVFPSLFLYRLARRGKRKVVGLFDQSSVSKVQPNGSSK